MYRQKMTKQDCGCDLISKIDRLHVHIHLITRFNGCDLISKIDRLHDKVRYGHPTQSCDLISKIDRLHVN